jgi:hypothetical protein
MKDIFGNDSVYLVTLSRPMVLRLKNDTEGVSETIIAEELSVSGQVVCLRPLKILVASKAGVSLRDTSDDPVYVPLFNVAGWVVMDRTHAEDVK